MNIAILSAGRGRADQITALSLKPEFRRATRNMMLAHTAIEQALAPIDWKRIRLATVLGSSFGELEQTKEFLRGLSVNGVARPIFFQSSLHNATLGFLSHLHSFVGPSFTVSQRYFTGEACIELAETILKSGDAEAVLMTAVDTVVDDLKSPMQMAYPVPVELTEGAAALVLALPKTAPRLGVQPIGFITGVECQSLNKKFEGGAYYDSNAIEQFISKLETKESISPLRLSKPDGTSSIIHWNRGGA